MLVFILVFILLAAVMGTAAYFIVKLIGRRRLRDSLQSVLLLVRIHKGTAESGGENDFKKEINLTEQLLGGLASLKKPFVLEIAVPHVGEEIHFYISVQRLVKEVAIKQIQGLWANASVEEAGDDYNIFNPHGTFIGAYLKQSENYSLPIRTYQEIGSDTFSGIIGALSKMNEIGEGAAVQILARPAASDTKEGRRIYQKLKEGRADKKSFRP